MAKLVRVPMSEVVDLGIKRFHCSSRFDWCWVDSRKLKRARRKGNTRGAPWPK